MLILTGKNLGERQKELNSKVAEAAHNKTNFDEIRSDKEHSDVDRLFKIELASKYKNIRYILDILKCGDSLYTTRALKCLWIYDDKYSEFINPTYCNNNIFPFMSTNMKKQMITTISLHVRSEDRAITFYTYCIKEKMPEYAFKFLPYTSDSFKMDLMKCSGNFKKFRDSKYLRYFVGKSFTLARAYIKMTCNSMNVLHELRYLYTVSAQEYLDLIEKYDERSRRSPNITRRLGLRVSNDILKRHKIRVINDPVLYVNKLNKNMLCKYLTSDDVKKITVSLLPDDPDDFWSMNFYNVYKFLLALIPSNEIYLYLKHIFTEKYNGKLFELDKRFYDLQYYEMLNTEEREEWALQHIEREKELFGSGNDYIWYKFVSFEKAFSGIKRYIYLTPDKDKRSRIVNILTESVRNHDDMTKLLNHYYERHVNESEDHKESFLNKVFAEHDVYAFETECWAALENLLYSLDVFTVGFYGREEYKMKVLIYYILHGKELTEVLLQLISNSQRFYHVQDIENLRRNKDRADVVAKFLIDFYTEKVIRLDEKLKAAEEEKKNEMSNKDITDEEKTADEYERDPIHVEIECEVYNVWNVIYSFKRDHSECPEIVMNYMESNWESFQYHDAFKTKFIPKSEGDFVRWLKQDQHMVIDGIEDIRCNTYRWNFRLSRLFRKLKVYFSEDVAKHYLEYFTEYLSNIPKGREYRNIKMAVAGVLHLADKNFKVTFIEKYVPTAPKIVHKNIDSRLLQTQRAICRLAYCSRPPIPLSNILKYIKGDYVHFILTLFNHYLVRQPMPLALRFTESILDNPVSIQKHGLRLAFVCFSSDHLVNLILEVWRKTHNVSLRMLLYETLFYRIAKENEDNQQALYDVLKHYTTQLHQDDHDNVFKLLVSSDLPKTFQGDFLETAWRTVSKLPTKSVNIQRQISVIRRMEANIHLVEREFPRVNIIDDHVHKMLFEEEDDDSDEESDEDIHGVDQLIEAKWDLTARYIVSFECQEELNRSLKLLKTIIRQCLKSWGDEQYSIYVKRQFIYNFINTIKEKAPHNRKKCGNAVPLYECILELFKSKPIKEIYLLVWDLTLSIMARKIIHKGTKRDHSAESTVENLSAEEIAKIFTNKVVKFIYQLLERQEFFYSFYQPIADILSDVCGTIGNIVNVSSQGICIYVCDNLANYKINETHILALMILSTDPPYYWGSEHSAVVAKLKEFDSEEIRSFMYKKFVRSDFQIRRYYE